MGSIIFMMDGKIWASGKYGCDEGYCWDTVFSREGLRKHMEKGRHMKEAEFRAFVESNEPSQMSKFVKSFLECPDCISGEPCTRHREYNQNTVEI